MFDDTEEVAELLTDVGEMMVVLDSDREYTLHTKNCSFNHEENLIYAEGMKDGEFVEVKFPPDVIEHYYTHREV